MILQFVHFAAQFRYFSLQARNSTRIAWVAERPGDGMHRRFNFHHVSG